MLFISVTSSQAQTQNSGIDTVMNTFVPMEPPVLTSAFIDTGADADLVYGALMAILAAPPGDSADEYKYVMSLKESIRTIHFVSLLDGELNNGGFNQFYANPSGQFAPDIPAALARIGAPKLEGLMKRANALYEREFRKITKDQDGTAEGFIKSYENNPLNALDTEFYNLSISENLSQLLARFIRLHKPDFVKR